MIATSAAAGRARLSVSSQVVLGAMVTFAALVHAALAQGSPSPWIVPDELIYADLAKGLVDGMPSIRGEESFGYGVGYALILAPVWAVFDDVSTAYGVAKGLNALLMSSTAVPSFFLARRFTTNGYALLVAGLSLAVPSLLYSGTLLTEVALYPAFALALLGISRATEIPTRLSQACALGAIAFACTIKMLAAVLLVAYVASIAMYHYLDTRERRAWMIRLRAYTLTWLSLLAMVLTVTAIAVTSGWAPLGAYDVVTANVDLLATPRWALLHVAELDLYLAVLPFAATVIVIGRGLSRSASSRERLFVSIALPTISALALVVGAFASTPFPGGRDYPEDISRLHERNMFMLAPIFFVGFALWLQDRRGRNTTVAVVGIVAVVLPVLVPVGSLDGNVRFQALALVPWVESADLVAWPVGGLVFTVAVGMLAATARYVEAPAAIFVAPVVIGLIVTSVSAYSSMHTASRWTRSVAWGESPRWIDEAVGNREVVNVLWFEPVGDRFVPLEPRHRIVFISEFFNRSVGSVFELGSPLPYGLPSHRVRLEGGRVVLGAGEPADLGDLVLAPCYVKLDGARVATDDPTGATVWRVGESPRVEVSAPTSCTRRVRDVMQAERE